jgi:hypothetical protein
MRSLFGISSLFGLLVVCSLSAQEGSAVKESSFYPLKKDNTWTYKVQSNKIEMKVTDVKGGEAKIETIVNGKSVASEMIQVKDDGIYRTAINGQKPDKPVKILQLPPKPNDSWEVDSKIQNQTIKGKFVVGEEKIKAAGKDWSAIVVKGENFSIAGMDTKVTYWFVDGVGIAKLAFELGGMKADLELEEFKPGGATSEKDKK